MLAVPCHIGSKFSSSNTLNMGGMGILIDEKNMSFYRSVYDSIMRGIGLLKLFEQHQFFLSYTPLYIVVHLHATHIATYYIGTHT